MVTTVRGSFNDVQGYFHADLDDMSKSSARVVLKAASVDTRNNDRDNHLRSADFFDVEKWPDITSRARRSRRSRTTPTSSLVTSRSATSPSR